VLCMTVPTGRSEFGANIRRSLDRRKALSSGSSRCPVQLRLGGVFMWHGLLFWKSDSGKL